MPGPLPKYVNWLIGAVAIGSAAYGYMHPGQPIPQWLATLSALAAMFTHSANGTGGK